MIETVISCNTCCIGFYCDLLAADSDQCLWPRALRILYLHLALHTSALQLSIPHPSIIHPSLCGSPTPSPSPCLLWLSKWEALHLPGSADLASTASKPAISLKIISATMSHASTTTDLLRSALATERSHNFRDTLQRTANV
ncbi:hypothetical protein BST61_g169 [Cercospora zeina]